MSDSTTQTSLEHCSSPDKQNDVMYRYALDDNHQVLEINSALVIKGKDYTCLSCNGFLRPVKGALRKAHFRHRALVDCSLETYLHKLAKHIFLQTYNDCLTHKKPFLVEYVVPIHCSVCKARVGSESKQVDLTLYFKRIRLESPDCGFIPDILLTTDTGSESLYIEIAVTHFVEESKADSGKRIIEISISGEVDIDLISSCCIPEEDPRVTIYNFKKEPLLRANHHTCPSIKPTDKSKQNEPSIPCFFLFKDSGKCLLKDCNKSEYDKLSSRSVYTKMLDIQGADSYIEDSDFSLQFFVDNIQKAHLVGNKFKNCWLCNFHRRKMDRSRLFETRQWHSYSYSYCNKHKRIIDNSNNASDCMEFWTISNLKAEDDLLMYSQLRAAKYREQQQDLLSNTENPEKK